MINHALLEELCQIKIISRFITWWKNPPEKKEKKVKPLSWRQEEELFRTEIVKRAKEDAKRVAERNKKESDGYGFLIGAIIVSGFILVGGLLAIGESDRKTRKNMCEEVGGVFEVVDTTFAGYGAVDIYGCVK